MQDIVYQQQHTSRDSNAYLSDGSFHSYLEEVDENIIGAP